MSMQKIESPLLADLCRSLIQLGNSGVAAGTRIAPNRRQLAGPLLDQELERLNDGMNKVFSKAAPKYGYTVSSDAFDDMADRHIINFVVSTHDGSFFVDAQDASDEKNTGDYIASFLAENMRALPGGVEACVAVCTDSAANCKKAGGILVEEFPWLTWIPCTAHIVDLYLEDVAKHEYFSGAVDAGRRIIKFVCSHSKSKSLFRAKSQLKLILYNDTRFATHCLAMERLIAVRIPLLEVVVSQDWADWLDEPASAKYREEAAAVKSCILADQFWFALNVFKSICEPAVVLMRQADSAKIGSVCKIYYLAANVELCIAKNEYFSADQKAEFQGIWRDRWTQLHSDLHAAAYVLDPEFAFHDGELPEQMADHQDELNQGFLRSLRKVFWNDRAKVAKAIAQHAEFMRGEGHMGEPEVQEAAKMMPAYIFWETHGSAWPELQYAAMRICAQISSSSVTERTWSNYDYVHNKRRNRLGVGRAKKLVQVYGRLRTEKASKFQTFADVVIPWRWVTADFDDDDAVDANAVDEGGDAGFDGE
jgi:hypothetical protein